jgi:hypothetical protein
MLVIARPAPAGRGDPASLLRRPAEQDSSQRHFEGMSPRASFRVHSRLSRASSVFNYRLSTGSPRISPPPTFRYRMSSVPQPAVFPCIRHVGSFDELATTRTPLRTGSAHHGLARCHAPVFLPER